MEQFKFFSYSKTSDISTSSHGIIRGQG